MSAMPYDTFFVLASKQRCTRVSEAVAPVRLDERGVSNNSRPVIANVKIHRLVL